MSTTENETGSKNLFSTDEPETESKLDSDPNMPQVENDPTSKESFSTNKSQIGSKPGSDPTIPRDDDDTTLKDSLSTNEQETGFKSGSDPSVPRAENDPTSKDLLSTNELQTGSRPSSNPNVSQADNDTTSKDSFTTNELRTGSKSASDPNVPRADSNTTSKDSFSTNEPETGFRQGSDHSVPQAVNDTISKDTFTTNEPETRSKPGSDPSIPQAQDDTTSKDSLSTNESETGSKPGSVPSVRLAENDTTSKDDVGTLPDGSANEIKPAYNETTQAADPTNQETLENENLQAQEVAHIENATISKESSLPNDNAIQSTQTRNQETGHTNDIEDNPREQDRMPSTSRHPSSPNNFPTQSKATSKPEKVPNKVTTNSSKDADPRLKKAWKKFSSFISKRCKMPKSPVVTAGPSDSTAGPSDDKAKDTAFDKLRKDFHSTCKGITKLKTYNESLIALKEIIEKEFNEPAGGKKLNSEDYNCDELKNALIKLKHLIPLVTEKDLEASTNLQSLIKVSKRLSRDSLQRMPQLHEKDALVCSPEFKDFEDHFNTLAPKPKICLLCFSIFPGNSIIRKRLMERWWVAEGLAASQEEADQHFLKLTKEGFIVPVNDNRSLSIGRYRMHPLYQTMLKVLAKKVKFFNFDDKGNPTQNYTNSFQVCLVGEGLLSREDLEKKSDAVDDLESIHLLMNVDEPILHLKPQWFSRMTNVNFLYLGRWQASDAAHIEVEETNFLAGLKNMTSIKFLSLQGISNIIKLNESILALTKLECLDLRASHNLEVIPAKLGLLKSLTHLDMSECYLLDHMPKSLSSLTNLRVFKGFVVGKPESKDWCTVADLRKLQNLTKLCIYTTWEEFPEQSQIECLRELSELRKLTITWRRGTLKAEKEGETSNPSEAGGNTSKKREKRGEKDTSSPPKVGGGTLNKSGRKGEGAASNPPETGAETPKERNESGNGEHSWLLEKLDLKCYPLKVTPEWMEPKNLQHLKKLYIRGGDFSDLGQYQDIKGQHILSSKRNVWTVQVLRLKYLSDIEIEWRQLHELFPRLEYLEQVNCPKLKLFNCGPHGVWMAKMKQDSPPIPTQLHSIG